MQSISEQLKKIVCFLDDVIDKTLFLKYIHDTKDDDKVSMRDDGNSRNSLDFNHPMRVQIKGMRVQKQIPFLFMHCFLLFFLLMFFSCTSLSFFLHLHNIYKP